MLSELDQAIIDHMETSLVVTDKLIRTLEQMTPSEKDRNRLFQTLQRTLVLRDRLQRQHELFRMFAEKHP